MSPPRYFHPLQPVQPFQSCLRPVRCRLYILLKFSRHWGFFCWRVLFDRAEGDPLTPPPSPYSAESTPSRAPWLLRLTGMLLYIHQIDHPRVILCRIYGFGSLWFSMILFSRSRGRRCEAGLRSSLLLLMQYLIKTLKRDMSPYLEAILKVAAVYWTVSVGVGVGVWCSILLVLLTVVVVI